MRDICDIAVAAALIYVLGAPMLAMWQDRRRLVIV